MPRTPKPYWDRKVGAYRTDAGGKTHYFRGIARSDRAGARLAFEAHLSEMGARMVRAGEPTVDQLFEAFLRHSKGRNRPRTYEGHVEILRAFAVFPGGLTDPNRYGLRRARMIRAPDLIAMERAWVGRGIGHHYRARLVRTVKACWAWAAKGDSPLIPANPLKDVPGVTVPHSRKRRVPKEEFGPFLRRCWRHARVARSGVRPAALRPGPTLSGRFEKLTCLLIRFVRVTGCRPGEACDLRWSDIDWEASIAVIPPERHKTGGKTGRARTIILTPSLVRALRAIERLPGRNETWVFTHKRGRGSGLASTREAGKPWEARVLAQKIRKLRDAAIRDGVPVRPDFRLYDLRHEIASAGRARGVGDDSIAVVLGTSAKMIAQVYGHLTPEDLRAVADRMRGRTPNP